MLSRYRLRHSSDFEQLRRSNLRWHDSLAVLVIKSNGLSYSRFAFVASKKVGKATSRNRAKRLLREAIKENFGSIKPGWDCMLIARQETSQACYKDVRTAVKELFEQAQLLTVTENLDC